ncbi:SEL1-like repeat protein [Neisseria weaveri]|uniref:Sel1 repeat protein n=1 Tax=Neisseria weaveri TaxID=28091 RepID=A0A3S4Z8U6_9NEIS|nr:tetratricopeptide repeat protein [Neisseria weaveri]EGV35645.1 hypothetical protein l13_13370 [Neisseria weaveri ATCC 51223]VEJ51003.1 sel1 repeat protein [Neisseria weaveri]
MNTQPMDQLFQQALDMLNTEHPDLTQATYLLQKAAYAGHIEAAFQLAGCLLSSTPTQADLNQAVYWLDKAAQTGHTYARYNLLQMHEANKDPIENLIGGYLKLAEEGFVPAQVRMLQYYLATHQAEKALHWAKTAAEQNHPQAQYYLAQHYQYAQHPDLAQAHRLYHAAAEQGLAAAHWQLGNQYRFGQGTEKNLETALIHLRQAAEQGIAPAQNALAELLTNIKPQEAFEWFQTASEQNDSDAHAALAHIYLVGQLTERNSEKARQHAEAAAQQNHPEATRILGDIYRYGLGVPADHETAQQLYRRASDLGSNAAMQKLLAETALQTPEAYETLKQQALQRQHTEKTYQEAFANHYGLSRPQNHQQALALYTEAAEAGHAKAQTNLGMMYYNGHGTKQDAQQAAKWFHAAADQSDPTAQYNLACLYRHGHGVEQDNFRACQWLQNAINSGHDHPDALQQLLHTWQTE